MSNEFDGVLRQGDCVKNNMDDVTYHKVAQAFLKAGCPKGEYESENYRPYKTLSFCGWNEGANRGFFHGTKHAFTRQLTVDQVLSTLEPTQWRGHQDGLPPVGTECEVNENGGYEVEIIAHSKNKAGDVAIYKRFIDGVLSVDFRVAECFRPIQTERDKAIEEMFYGVAENAIDTVISMRQSTSHDIARSVLGYLFDAGWRPRHEAMSETEALDALNAAYIEGAKDHRGGLLAVYQAIKSGEVVV
jgi:hypothetical protein